MKSIFFKQFFVFILKRIFGEIIGINNKGNTHEQDFLGTDSFDDKHFEKYSEFQPPEGC